MTRVSFTVPLEDTGKRLDQLVKAALPSHSRRLVRELFAGNLVHVNGRPARKGAVAEAGSVVSFPEPEADVAHPNPLMRLDVVMETEHLVIINKQAAVASVPNAPSDRDTIANGLLALFPEMAGVGHKGSNYSLRDAGLVHRLDTQTSGLLLAARSAEAHQELVSGLRKQSLQKGYLAIAPHPPDASGTLTTGLKPHPTNKRRVVIDDAAPPKRRYTTRYSVLPDQDSAGASVTNYVLLKVDAGAAYRHQIRIHLASLGCPLLGDTLYGGQRPEVVQLPPSRHALHAHTLTYSGGALVSAFSVSCPLATDLANALKSLRQR